MFSNMRRVTPFVLILALCLAPLTAVEAGGIKDRGSKLVASQGILGWAGQLWQRMASVWGQEGVSIDPSGGTPTPPANGNTGNGTTTTTPPIDPNNG